MKLTDILKQIIQEKKAKRDRCLRIADRKFNKPSAYKSGAVVRCRQGKIWKGLKEEENPPNIEYIKPNFEYEWEEAIRYPEFKKMGFDNWVKTAQKGYEVNFSDIKDKLKNVDLNFDSLNQDKKIRFINAFKTNQIELPIAVKFSENDYDLVGGNTRLSGLVRKGIDPKIWIVDLTTLKENHKAYAKERYEADLIEGKIGNLYHTTNATAATNILKEGYINPANINLKQYIGTSNPPWWYSDEFGEPQPLYGDFIYAASNYKEGFFGVSNPEVTFIIDGDKVKNSGIDIYKAPESMEKGVCLIQGSVSLKFINKIIINGDLIDEEDKINLILIIKNKKIKYIVYDTLLKEDNQPSEGSYQQALKDIKPIIPVLSHNLIHQQSLEHNEENMVKLNQKIFDLVKKGDGTILDRLWDLAGNSLLKNAINIITFYHKSNLSEAKKETLRTWFKRKGAPGKTGGWVDCNSPIRKDGKITGYKPCGRQKGEERAKYPSCRPTSARCKDKGKGTKWGKTK
jgi:hypothetical protein